MVIPVFMVKIRGTSNSIKAVWLIHSRIKLDTLQKDTDISSLTVLGCLTYESKGEDDFRRSRVGEIPIDSSLILQQTRVKNGNDFGFILKVSKKINAFEDKDL
ncbi:hypothetical protein Syun_020637 [Stephania yunnanensis]|uniref:Uncharacterized protein n=1 Tax=Stephania yunnanensis TaxID=152371 RepID=A0AAP0IEK5_9MAGN